MTALPLRRDIALRVSGMTCASCVARVERALSRAAPGAEVAVNLASEEARIAGIDGALDPAALVAAVEEAGYEARMKAPPEAEAAEIAARDRTDAPCASSSPRR